MSAILIAEDHDEIASFIDKGLRASGYRTTIVGDGRQAWALAGTGAFDLLILDVGLPGLDGFEVLRRLRGDDVDLLQGGDGLLVLALATLQLGGSGATMPPPGSEIARAVIDAFVARDYERAAEIQLQFALFPSKWMHRGLAPAMKALSSCDSTSLACVATLFSVHSAGKA